MTSYTPTEAAGRLGCALSTVYRLVRTGRLECETGRPLRIGGSHMDDWAAFRADAFAGTVTVSAAADRLGVSTRAVYKMIDRQRLICPPWVRGHLRVDTASLDRLVTERAARPG